MFKVSQSKIKTWRQCRKAYYYKYVKKITRKYKPMPFLRGTIVHEMLEAHYKGKEPWPIYKKILKENEKVLRTHADDYGDLAGHLKFLMKGYFKYYKKEKVKAISIEKEFTIEVSKGIYLTGKMDLIAKHQKLKWMIEHKCHNVIPTGGMVPYNNMQSALYLWAYELEHGVKLDGVMWNYLLGKPLPIPQVLKSGEMSRRKTSTTWAVYRAALKEAGLKPKDYLDMKAELTGNEDLVYQRLLIPRNNSTIESIAEDTITTAKEIKRRGGKDQTRNLGRHCDYCEFKNLCAAQLKGLDDNYILKSEFKKREKPNEPQKNSKKD